MDAAIPIYHTQNRFIKMEVGIKGRNCKKVARKNNWKHNKNTKPISQISRAILLFLPISNLSRACLSATVLATPIKE